MYEERRGKEEMHAIIYLSEASLSPSNSLVPRIHQEKLEEEEDARRMGCIGSSKKKKVGDGDDEF